MSGRHARAGAFSRASPDGAGDPMRGWGVRVGRFVRGSYAPLPSAVFALLWAYGGTGLFAAVDPAGSRWRPGGGTAVAAVTLLVDLLLMRALDDIRDLDYDRRFHPGRPLASGAVRVRDLAVLYGAGAVVLVVLNSAWPWRAAVLLVQLGYAAAAVGVHRRWGRPPADRLFAGLLVSLPAPVLLHLYLYAGYLDSAGHGPDGYGFAAIAVAVAAAGHVELAGKLTRVPRAGERTYVTTLGVTGTLALALAVAVLSAGLLAAFAEPGWRTLAAVAPLAVPALAAWDFARGRARWPRLATAAYPPLTFAGCLALGLAR
ncbi:prenyltransferase [Mycobacterium tuberculosis]|nr:prenyltransferase [Mycobacterium tuberculosis]